MTAPSYTSNEKPWYQRRLKGWTYLSILPHRRLLSLYLAIFFLFSIFGFYDDLVYNAGNATPWAVLLIACVSGAYAMLYPYVLIHRPALYLWLVAFINFFTGPFFAFWLHSISLRHPPHFRHAATGIVFAAQGINIAVICSYIFFISFIRAQASSALRIQNELDLAHGIQRTLVPPLDMAVPGYQLNGISLPSDKVGGDLVDIVPVASGTVAYVADVAGHGLQAGILMGMVKTAARTILLEEFNDPALLLAAFCERLNRVLPGVKEAHMYCTLAAIHLSQDGRVHYALAGHPAILKYNAADKSVSPLACEQFPVGLLPVGSFVTQDTRLSAGDMLIVSTDGILEASNSQEEEFGSDRLGDLARRHATESSLGSISRDITESVQQFGKQVDDQTLLLIRRLAITEIGPSSVTREQLQPAAA